MVSKTRKQKAGTYQHEGSFGCVYRPALHCKGNASRAPNSISKVQFEYQADKEFKQQAPLEAIDPEKKYFLSATRVCEPDLGKVDPVENNLKPCSLAKNAVVHSSNLNAERYFQKNLTNAKIVEYLDGGENLWNFKPSKTQYVQIFKGFENLLEGLVKLHAAGFVHLDIKEPNIVVKTNPDETLHMRFIDFGFLSNAETFHTVLADYQLLSYYPYWPLDIFFARSNPQIRMPPAKDIFSIFVTKYINKLKKYDMDTKIPASTMDEILKKKKYYDTYTESYEEYDSMKNGEDDSEALKALLPTIDIYMLGYLMASLVYKYTGMREIAIRDPYLTIYITKMDKPKGQQAGTETEKNWTNEVEKEIGGYLYQLLDKMMDPDFRKRPSAEDALEEYRKILPAIEELFTENAVHDILGVQGGGKRKTKKQKKSKTK